jgi:transposase
MHRASRTPTARNKGYDAGKKVSGIKRHIVVDTQGLPHAIVVTTANITDRQGALMAIDQHAANLSAVTALLVDGGYAGQPFAESVRTLIGAEVQVAKRHELHAPTLGRRTIVRLAGEMPMALEKYRALAQYQLAVRQSGFLGAVAAEILNRL